MKTKDFREIQVSSTLLVVIFLCVLILGVFIFLLGVSVGKKQVQIAAATQVVAQQIQAPAKEEPGLKTAEPLVKDEAKTGPEAQPGAGLIPSGSQPAAAPSEKKTKSAPETAVPAGEARAPASKAPAPTPAKTSPAKTAAQAGTGLYYVQVAAFTDKGQAAAEAEKFRKRGYPVVVADPRPSDTKTWYRVRVGGYPTREKAAAVLTKLNETAKKPTDYRVVKD